MTYEQKFPKDKWHGSSSYSDYDFDKVSTWTTNEIKNAIWAAIECCQPVPGCISLKCLRDVLISRGESPCGYHNT